MTKIIKMKGRYPYTRINHFVKVTVTLLILLGIAYLLFSCKQECYAYLNTDRRPKVVRISERYTNPPEPRMVTKAGYISTEWIPYKVITDTLPRDIGATAYKNIKPDTLISTCSIDKRDSAFKIEIRKYSITFIHPKEKRYEME